MENLAIYNSRNFRLLESIFCRQTAEGKNKVIPFLLNNAILIMGTVFLIGRTHTHTLPERKPAHDIVFFNQRKVVKAIHKLRAWNVLNVHTLVEYRSFGYWLGRAFGRRVTPAMTADARLYIQYTERPVSTPGVMPLIDNFCYQNSNVITHARVYCVLRRW